MLIVLLIFPIIWHVTGAVECPLPPEPKIRIFDTILSYQGNKIPFSHTQGGWQGSNIEFSFNTIDNLPKNIFISTNSSAIVSLKLSDKKIQEVDEGAFISLTCLRELLLDHNDIAELSRDVFLDLGNLHHLDLSHNKLEILNDLTLEHLSSLRILNLGNNRIRHVEILAFRGLSSMEILNLEQNQISQISPELFRFTPNLTNLVLSWNRLWTEEPETWVGLSKLENLELAGNNLNRFDPTYNFSFSDSLKSLNLSFNALTVLNVFSLRKHFTRLEQIDLNHNPWFCDDLGVILHELNDSRIKIVRRNLSSVGIHQTYGIFCSDVRTFTTIDGVDEVSTSTPPPNGLWITREELERYVEKKISDNNHQLKNSIESTRGFAIFVFALLCVFILIEVLHRSNVCGTLFNKFQNGNELYTDDSNLENFRLLHR